MQGGIEEMKAKANILRFLKLEATWILTNLAYGDDDEIMSILEFKYGQNQSFKSVISGLLKQS